MATAVEIATKALKRLSIVQAGAAASAVDVTDAIDALNAMVNAWEADSVSVTLPIDDRFEQGVVAMLAVRLAEDYGRPVGDVLARDARAGWQNLQAHYIQAPAIVFDWALTRTPSRRNVEGAVTSIDGTRAWQASTSFELAELVTNAGNVYVCIVAGVSGTAGPTGTALNQTDGSCSWDYVQAIGG